MKSGVFSGKRRKKAIKTTKRKFPKKKSIPDLLGELNKLKQALRGAPKQGSEKLRAELRAVAVALLCRAPVLAAENNISRALWSSAFYNVIADQRSQIRRYERRRGAATGGDAAAVVSAAAVTQKLRKVRARLHATISQAVAFYKTLSAALADRLRAADAGATAVCLRESCHRCLVQLGDLHRYKVLDWAGQRRQRRACGREAPLVGATSSIWDEPKRYYHRAIALLPADGGPHNQLAVVATYCAAETAKMEARERARVRNRATNAGAATPGEASLDNCVLERARHRLEAVFRYCFALATKRPFETAWPNLLLLFKQFGNDARRGMEGAAADAGDGGGGGGSDAVRGALDPLRVGRRWKEQQAAFILRFLRLHGVAHEARHGPCNKASVTKAEGRFSSLASTCLCALDSLLAMNKIDPVILLKCTCVNSLTTTRLTKGSSNDRGGDGILGSLGKLTLKFACEFAATVARRVVVAMSPTPAEGVGVHALGSVLATCAWLRQSGAHCAAAEVPCSAGAAMPPSSVLSCSLWNAIAALLNRIIAQGGIGSGGGLAGSHPPPARVLLEDVALAGFSLLDQQTMCAQCTGSTTPKDTHMPKQASQRGHISRRGHNIERLRRMMALGESSNAVPPIYWDAATRAFRVRVGGGQS